MAAKPGFNHHHAAAKQAMTAGDHSKAMHHIGHQMRIAQSAAKGQPLGATPNQDTDAFAAPMSSPMPFNTPVMPSPNGMRQKPSAPTVPAKQNGAFAGIKARFASMRGK